MEQQNCSNNTNKLSPQERLYVLRKKLLVQIIQINLVLKNNRCNTNMAFWFK